MNARTLFLHPPILDQLGHARIVYVQYNLCKHLEIIISKQIMLTMQPQQPMAIKGTIHERMHQQFSIQLLIDLLCNCRKCNKGLKPEVMVIPPTSSRCLTQASMMILKIPWNTQKTSRLGTTCPLCAPTIFLNNRTCTCVPIVDLNISQQKSSNIHPS